MKLLDKLKNVFFEEVEEEDDEELPQSFAKKVEVPKKKIEHFEMNEVPKQEEIKEEKKEIPVRIVEEKKEIQEEKKEENNKEFPMMFDDDDFLEDSHDYTDLSETVSSSINYRRETYNEEKGLYQGKKELSYAERVNNKPSYSYTKSYYEEKETKGFKPSPIISPIYGILDKNYHKEEVVTKRETRITSTFSKPDLDSVRNKAFGSEDVVTEKRNNMVEPKEEKVYDVNSNKPQVNRVTLADADEYYNDLGLAYNVDYSDASRTTTRTSKYSQKEKKTKKNNSDDNLFDLIDSMYNKED